MAKLYLIDGMSLVFRAYHALARTGLRNAAGEPTGAIFGFANILTSLLEKNKPERMAVVFDTSHPTFRHERYPLYKANRAEFPEDLGPQLEKIKYFIDYMGVTRIEMPGFEADDIIATFAKFATLDGYDTYCVTSDKDYYQLVTDHVKILKPGAKGDELDLVSYEGVFDKFGVKPAQVIEVQALIGDSVDNVPGVKGVGEKSAIPLIQQYGTLEKLYENIEAITAKALKQKLIDNREMAFLSRELVTLHCDMELPISYKECLFKEPDYSKLDDFFRDQNFRTLRQKWVNKAIEANARKAGSEFGEAPFDAGQEETVSGSYSTFSPGSADYKMISNAEELRQTAALVMEKKGVAFDLETSSLDRDRCRIVGISLSWEENTGCYIPVYYAEKNTDAEQGADNLFDSAAGEEKQEMLTAENAIEINEALDILRPLLTSEKIGKYGQNAKFDAYILLRHGLEVGPITFDTMIASYILNPDQKHNLDAISEKWLRYTPIPITSLIGTGRNQISMADLPPEKISDYASEDADLVMRLMAKMQPELEANNQVKLAYEVEFPIISVLTRMESNGVALDTGALTEMSGKIMLRVKDLKKMIYDEAGSEFNIDSPKQLGHILFEKMMIPTSKKTKSGFSTDVSVLQELEAFYPIAKYILEYRQLAKLRSTYIDALPKLVNPVTGRIHTTYNQTVAATGRLSSTDPNLQNIPIRTDLGKEIRKAFVPQKEGNVILSADYSQIELRIMAYISGDDNLIKGFEEGKDIHAATASVLYDVELDKVDSDMRRVAKTVNFGIMYGLGPFGLSQRLGIGRAEGKNIIDNYNAKYKGIQKYMADILESTREKGYAETVYGRRRYFHNIISNNRVLRSADERAAINMPIQGTASDMMKLAMIRVDKALRAERLKTLMMLQVHDELVFEVPEAELETVRELVKREMEAALPLGNVPVVVDTGHGRNWFEAH